MKKETKERRQPLPQEKEKSQIQEDAEVKFQSQLGSDPQPQPDPQPKNLTSSNETRARKRPYIPVSVIKELHLSNQSRCSFISRTTGKRCNETHSLQIEHLVPFAKGGSSHRVHRKQKHSPLPKKAGGRFFLFTGDRGDLVGGQNRGSHQGQTQRSETEKPSADPVG